MPEPRKVLLTVDVLDRHLKFLQHEAQHLRGTGKRWAQDKAAHVDEIAEILRQKRQELQMQGVVGRVDEA
jgi:hypothetical protein